MDYGDNFARHGYWCGIQKRHLMTQQVFWIAFRTEQNDV